MVLHGTLPETIFAEGIYRLACSYESILKRGDIDSIISRTITELYLTGEDQPITNENQILEKMLRLETVLLLDFIGCFSLFFIRNLAPWRCIGENLVVINSPFLGILENLMICFDFLKY